MSSRSLPMSADVVRWYNGRPRNRYWFQRCWHPTNLFPEQGFNPFPRDNVRSVPLPGMQLHSGMSLDVRTYLFICFDKSFSTKVTREIDDGLVAGTLFVRHILITVFPGNRIDCATAVVPITNKLAIIIVDIRFIVI